jgi:hypothetical protein
MDMSSIIKTITDVLVGIPVIGDIVKMIMGMFDKGGDDQPADETTDGE